MQIQQANFFFNYTAGLGITEVDLVKTAGNLLKSKLVRTVCFSELKAAYIDEQGKMQLEWIQPITEGSGSVWKIDFSDNLPPNVLSDLVYCLKQSFYEQQIEAPDAKQLPESFRASLPPVILEKDELTIVLHPWLKVYSDGIITLSFQLDKSWDNLDESDFIEEFVNFYKQSFERIWIRKDIQKLDVETILPSAFQNELSIGGHFVKDRKVKKLLKKMRHDSLNQLEKYFNEEGSIFDINDEEWGLNPIFGSVDGDKWEGNLDLCRSIYINAITSQIITTKNVASSLTNKVERWVGRPSISLMRFSNQPDNKPDLFENFSSSISKILMRASELVNDHILPKDLRLFNDYSLHANRGILLWTWLRSNDEPLNAWDDNDTNERLFENQARAEHFEYYNMRIERSCSIACAPLDDESLIYAYKVLASTESVLHSSSSAGEITDALNSLLENVGALKLIDSAKEQARWHLDERRYHNEKTRSYIDRWLAVLFGFIGSTGLADLVVQPFLIDAYPSWSGYIVGLTAFSIALGVVGLIAATVWIIYKTR